jgi:hypothetical protein
MTRRIYIGCDVDAEFDGHMVRLARKRGPAIYINTGSVDILWGELNKSRIERLPLPPPSPWV